MSRSQRQESFIDTKLSQENFGNAENSMKVRRYIQVGGWGWCLHFHHKRCCIGKNFQLVIMILRHWIELSFFKQLFTFQINFFYIFITILFIYNKVLCYVYIISLITSTINREILIHFTFFLTLTDKPDSLYEHLIGPATTQS